MTLDEFVSLILEQLKSAKSYAEVDKIIYDSLNNITKNKFIINQYLLQVEIALDTVSPLDCDSTQWSCLRYALICLRRITANEKDNTMVA